MFVRTKLPFQITVSNNKTTTNDNGDGTDDDEKKDLYFILEIHQYLNLFSMSKSLKSCSKLI